MSLQYEPFGGEELEGVQPAVVAPIKRRKKRTRRSGAAVVGIVALVILGLAVVVLAIALPIVFTRQQVQTQTRNGDLSINPNAASGGTGSNGAPSWAGAGGAAGPGAPGAAVAASNSGSNLVPGAPLAGQLLTGGGVARVAGAPGGVAAAPVGPNINTGSGNVVCYRSVTGEMLPGAFTLTGFTSSEDGIDRTEVRSCASGSRMFLLSSQLVVCNEACQMPVWMGVASGVISPPIWAQQYVCRGDQVYINQMTPRFTFYWRFAGFVQEQLITACTTNDGYWVPNIELRFCQPQETAACQAAFAARTVPVGPPVISGSLPAGTVQTARPVCEHTADNRIVSWWATGASRSSYSFLRVRFVDQIAVAQCGNKTAVSGWLDIDNLVPCQPAVASLCQAGTTA